MLAQLSLCKFVRASALALIFITMGCWYDSVRCFDVLIAHNANHVAISQAKGGHAEARFEIVKDDKWGCIDIDGNLAISPQFDFSLNFSDGLAGFHAGDMYGFVDIHGRTAIQPRYTAVDYWGFHEGLAGVRAPVPQGRVGLWGFIDKKGQWVVSPQFDYVSSFSQGLAYAEKKSVKGYINRRGRFVLRLRIDHGEDFSNGMAAVIRSGRWGFIDRKGRMIVKPRYYWAQPFREGLALVNLTPYSPAPPFLSGGRKGELPRRYLCGYIDRTGRWAIRPRWFAQEPSDFSEGLACVSIPDPTGEGRYGYLDKRGVLVIGRKYQIASSFSDGLAVVLLPEKRGEQAVTQYIDHAGKVVLEFVHPTGTVFEPFENGLAYVTGLSTGPDTARPFYINKNGKFVFGDVTGMNIIQTRYPSDGKQ